jgi:hypothetical protein
MKREPEVAGGLRIAHLDPAAHGWWVEHVASGKPAVAGYLRQRRFAEQLRADLLATGVDFEQDARVVSAPAELERWRPVYYLWRQRARQGSIDLVTGEHYSVNSHYGQPIPSQENARVIAAALACYLWS